MGAWTPESENSILEYKRPIEEYHLENVYQI